MKCATIGAVRYCNEYGPSAMQFMYPDSAWSNKLFISGLTTTYGTATYNCMILDRAGVELNKIYDNIGIGRNVVI